MHLHSRKTLPSAAQLAAAFLVKTEAERPRV
jgi:hypothetical protein